MLDNRASQESALRTALESLSRVAGTGGWFAFSPSNHFGPHELWVLEEVIRDGLRRFALNAEDERDITQRVLIEIMNQSEVPEHPRAWLVAVAQHEALDLLRSAWKKKFTLKASFYDRDSVGEAHAPFEEAEQREFVQVLLEQLPPDVRTTLILYYMEGRNADEIGKLTGRGRSAVAMQLMRARSKLFCLIQERIGG
jgi:RNA polymerase sigma factor (sigma-70 family)